MTKTMNMIRRSYQNFIQSFSFQKELQTSHLQDLLYEVVQCSKHPVTYKNSSTYYYHLHVSNITKHSSFKLNNSSDWWKSNYGYWMLF